MSTLVNIKEILESDAQQVMYENLSPNGKKGTFVHNLLFLYDIFNLLLCLVFSKLM